MVMLINRLPTTTSVPAAGDHPTGPLVDQYGRHVSYLRLSVTDRCDLRCTYCMSEAMTFLPKSELLSLEELETVATAFIQRGVQRIRITGGEPLVRKDIMTLIKRLGHRLGYGSFQELTLTTNGTLLERYAEDLFRAGIRRINVSIDSPEPEAYARITRGGSLEKVLAGLRAAREVGLAIKINAVALRNDNLNDLADMVRWVHGQGMDLTLIEAMPMGEIDEDRVDQYIPLKEVRQGVLSGLTLVPADYATGGPARYFDVRETGGRLGLITPLSHNFCEACNRVRLTCTGKLYLCLGQEHSVDLREALRAPSGRIDALHQRLDDAMAIKPKGHDFVIERRSADPAVPRHMSVTGG